MPEAALPAVSELLAEWGPGDRRAIQALIPLLYDELHQVAHRYLRKARSGYAFQIPILVKGSSWLRRATSRAGRV